jgi:hypothetical protein
MVAEIITNVAVILVVVLLVVTLRISKRPKHIILGIILILYGGLKASSYHEILKFDIPDLPVITYMISIVVTVGSAHLILDSIKEKSVLRWASLTIGILVIVLSVTPTLYELNAITFVLPSYPEFINFYLYVITGILLLIAAFIVKDNLSGNSFV